MLKFVVQPNDSFGVTAQYLSRLYNSILQLEVQLNVKVGDTV